MLRISGFGWCISFILYKYRGRTGEDVEGYTNME